MKFLITLIVAMVVCSSLEARPYYGGGSHTKSHGGNYTGGSGSSHKGGRYISPSGKNEYGRHK